MSEIVKAQVAYEEFPQKFSSVIISTVSAEGIPNASYAPFVIDEQRNIYIFVSGLSTHTKNIYAHPYVSVLFIEDEAQTQQIFARSRLSFDCRVNSILRESDVWYHITQEFQQRFGEIIETLSSLTDFQIFQLVPTNGRFVLGFGAAYHISGEHLDQLVHITKDNAG